MSKLMNVLKMSTWVVVPMLLGCTTLTPAAGPSPITVTDLKVEGRIEGENATFDITCRIATDRKHFEWPVVSGDLAYLSADLPAGARIERQGDALVLVLEKKTDRTFKLSFAARPEKETDWRRVRFSLPNADVRRLLVGFDRPDLEVQFPGALGMDRGEAPEGGQLVTAYLGVAGECQLRWKPEVRLLDAALTVDCEARTVASAGVGALRLDSSYRFRVVQGELRRLVLDVPSDVNITHVEGADIRQWFVRDENQGRLLEVVLNRPQTDAYLLRVQSERVLPAFPCSFDLPLMRPREVIRTSGFLLVGTDSAVKLRADQAKGLTQIDRTAFPATKEKGAVQAPDFKGSAYAYQFANMPFNLSLSADDIVTALHAEEQILLSWKDRDLEVQAQLELDIRLAPAREIKIETDPAWVVAAVEGGQVTDYQVSEENGQRVVTVYFGQAVLGHTVVNVRLERTATPDETRFDMPRIAVRDALSERGFIALAAERGILLVPEQVEALREVPTGSLPAQWEGVLHAFRFKSGDWALAVQVEAEQPAIHSEIFHLVSLGDGALYGSSSVTYHIGGAPVRELKLTVPESFRNVEFAGRDIRSWSHEGGVWTVSLQEKAVGDYTLLVTYDRQFQDEGDSVTVGGVETVDTDSEVGYIALAGASGRGVQEEGERSDTMIKIDSAEIPPAYALLIQAPVLQAYKYVRKPHQATLRISRLDSTTVLSQVADHTTYATRLSEEGELITTADYFVKNTSGQFLTVNLPEGTRLWSATVDGDTVQPLASGGGAILVPLLRHEDPNRPSRVQLIYAEPVKPLGLFTRLSLRTPVTGLPSVYARWSLSAPEDFAVRTIGGNMVEHERDLGLGLRAVAGWFSGAFDRLGWIGLFLLTAMLLCGSLVAYHVGRGRSVSFANLGTLVLLVAAVTGLVVQQANAGSDWIQSCQVMLPNADGAHLECSKAVGFENSGPELVLWVVPSWVGARGSLLFLGLGVVGALLLTVLALRTPHRRRGRLALAVTILIAGLAQTAATLPVAVGVIGILIPAALAAACCRGAFRSGRRVKARRPAPVVEEPPPLAPVMPLTPIDGQEGFARLGSIVIAGCMALLLAVSWTWSAEEPVPQTEQTPPVEKVEPAPPPLPNVTSSTLTAELVPSNDDRRDPVVRVDAVYAFKCDEPTTWNVLPAGSVLTSHTINDRLISLFSDAEGYHLQIDQAGTFEVTLQYLTPVQETDGSHVVHLGLPEALKSTLEISLPDKDLEMTCAQAVMLDTEESDEGTSSSMVFGSTPSAEISWRPRARRTDQEEAVFFSDINTYGVLDVGVVTLTHLVHYQIAQGEIQTFSLEIPAGMSVTSVRGAGLRTWRYDPDAHLLEAVLDKPVTADYALTVVSQIPQEGLPYDVNLSAPVVQKAGRQRGALALAAPDAVQVMVDEVEGLHTMNIDDFSQGAVAAWAQGATGRSALPVKRAFRYHQLPVGVTVQARAVLPEIRVTEQSNLDVSFERIVLSSRLSLDCSKAGVFFISLQMPEGYDVESLTGQDISHWDEVDEDSGEVRVHFNQQALGTRELNVVLARTEKGLGDRVVVPRIRLTGALKHIGTLAVSSEKGVRAMTDTREGVSEIHPRELGIETPGYLAFRLLRPEWGVILKTEVMEPGIRADVLHRVDLSEGMVQGSAHLRYRIEGAGAKRFLVQAPQPGIPLTVQGRTIARVQEIDPEQGLWQVELHNKVYQVYNLEVSYIEQHDPTAEQVLIRPIRAANAQSQKGYLVVTTGSRLQVQPADVSPGLNPEDARSVPREFGAGDLSDAVLCYRATRPDVTLGLSVVRHNSAEVLPARVEHVRLTSVVSEDRYMATRAELQLRVGDLRTLATRLPDAAELWSVFVSGKAVTPLVEDGELLIPLDPASAGEASRVEVIYGSRLSSGHWTGRSLIDGPRFNLPLADIEWSLFLPPRFRCFGYEGTLQPRDPTRDGAVSWFDTAKYLSNAEQETAANVQRAEEVLRQGEQFAREGRQTEARKAFEAAMNYSQGQADFNEDARIQYRNLSKQQAIVGLVNRRDNLKRSLNVQGDGQALVPDEVLVGNNWTQDLGQKVVAALSTKDNDTLNKVADKLLDQQAAAEGHVPAIHVTLPWQGRQKIFHRPLHIQPYAPLEVSFRTLDRRWSGAWMSVVVALVLFGVLRLALGRAPVPREET